MYAYTDFDRQFVRQRAAQYRDQLERHLAGTLPEDEFRPLRLQNGWYVQRHAPMLRVAVPYGEIHSAQLRMLARIAREFDRGFAHLTTRQNVQFNWIPLDKSADVMDLLASVGLHGIQTSGNCIRNTTTDAFAGIAPDELVDPRPYAEILRQWTTLHPEFAFLPRKFKIAISGAREDRTASAWHDIGLQLHRNAAGEVGFRVLVGGGMGRTPAIGVAAAEFLPWQQVLVFIEAIVRVYNRYGRRDNLYKSRIKILVKAEGQRFLDAVKEEFRNILELDADGRANLIPQAELDRVARSFEPPSGLRVQAAHEDSPGVTGDAALAYRRWIERNVHGHRLAGYRIVTLSLKRVGQPPGDATAEQMEQAAALADAYSLGELRVTHEQNLVLPWVRVVDLPQLWAAARAAGYANPNRGLLTDMIACPGGDLCALANARTIPIAAAIAERFDDLDEAYDIGDVALHMSGCINSCGHHHSGHIGILGVDKDGAEWYQVTLGGSDGSRAGGPAVPGRVIGPSFAADEVADVVESLIDTYRAQRRGGERFIDCLRRIGIEPFKAGAYATRHAASEPA